MSGLWQFVNSHACDKATHVKCVQNSYDEDQYRCIKCKPTEEENSETIEEANESEINQEEEHESEINQEEAHESEINQKEEH